VKLTLSPSLDIIILFPFCIPVYVPKPLSDAVLDTLGNLRVISPKQDRSHHGSLFVRLNFPMNFITAPLIADLLLLAILAIGRQEVHDGTIGDSNISPIDVIVVFLALGYIANSIEASGLIRYLAFKVLQKGGKVGHRLFFYLYAFFFGLGIFIGNDPIMVLFLSYMIRVSSNILHPRAWVHTQFAVANIATAILVSSNPTNLVLAGAFNIKFIYYTANMIVPVISTAIVLFPFLLYIVFADESLIPFSIKMHELSEEAKNPVNPNIPHARGLMEEQENTLANDEQRKLLSLEEILNPFLDKGSAAFGAIVMVSTIIILLVLNAVYLSSGGHPDYWVTLPAAFIMFSWDLVLGWYYRHETRKIAFLGRKEVERAQVEKAIREMEEAQRTGLELRGQEDISSLTQTCSTAAQLQSQSGAGSGNDNITDTDDEITPAVDSTSTSSPCPRFLPNPTHVLLVFENGDCWIFVTNHRPEPSVAIFAPTADQPQNDRPSIGEMTKLEDKQALATSDCHNAPPQELSDTASSRETDVKQELACAESSYLPQWLFGTTSSGEMDEKKQTFSERISREVAPRQERGRPTLISLVADAYRWSQETFPTATAALENLPFELVPFAFSMFVLVQALVNKGWVPVFAHGWDHWVNKTGTVGSICGMGFLSVVLCNVSFYTWMSY
jgi:Na+/H+ antiporter NhaD/arsenite permease-like protein